MTVAAIRGRERRDDRWILSVGRQRKIVRRKYEIGFRFGQQERESNKRR